MALDFGRMRERIRIEQATENRNAIGEVVQSWEKFADRWASVDGLSSREFLLQGQQQTEISHRVRLRYLEGMHSGMRIVWRNRLLEINSLLEHRNRSEHEALCVERVGTEYVPPPPEPTPPPPPPPPPPEVFSPANISTETDELLVTETEELLVTES
jgi:SPP1 family predicted phage head-tail adaptor